jgi:hypothetical protein
MKPKGIMIIVVLLAVAVGGLYLAIKLPKSLHKAKAAKAAVATAQKPGAAASAKKAPLPAPKKIISKGKGALVIKLADAAGKPASRRMKAFKATDHRSSEYVASFTCNKTQELLPGTYDIEIETVPQKIYKNLNVSLEKETVEDLGCLTGLLKVTAVNAQGKSASYPVRVLYPKSDIVVTTLTTGKQAAEIVAGTYDLEIALIPKQARKDVRLEAGKETAIDLGCITGMLNVSSVDNNNNPVRSTTRIKKSESGELVATGVTNKPIELAEGIYTIEVSSKPAQVHKDVKIKAGQETAVAANIALQAK